MAKKNNITTFKIYNLSQANDEIKRLKQEGARFETERTANSCKIKIFKNNGKQIVYWYIENTKSQYFLILLNKLKREIRANQEVVKRSKYSSNIEDVKYYFFSKAIKDVQVDAGSVYEFDNVYEADVSHAYYRAAYVMRFISKELYHEIVRNLSKHERLRLLGCIATVKIWEKYENGYKEDGEKMQDDLLRDAWFKICHYVDSALLELKDKLKDNFLFYWVDGIYFKYDRPSNVESIDLDVPIHEFKFMGHIRDIKYKYDLDFKVISIKNFKLMNMDNRLEITVEKPDGKVKRFFPDRKVVKSYSIVGLNELNKFK